MAREATHETYVPAVTWQQVADDEVHIYTPDGTWCMFWAETMGWEVHDPGLIYRGSWADASDALAFVIDPYAA